jgi:hypothetical protein
VSLRKQLVRELGKLGVEEHAIPGRDDGFAGLTFKGADIGHFHDDHELDLRLGKQLIASEGLQHVADSRVHPKRAKSSPWIEVRLEAEGDIKKIVRLIKLCIEKL